eukprot:TRINITY_DN111616_c0_g1_i1.p1 TRINITY_DN111616_c0_g1~~TRINITY_DN111616_c0_g1_i1.p1  ORF type:complete len:134 (-),score=12.07 TRINITY_DN111616_c0_g1_i1:415-816(-)
MDSWATSGSSFSSKGKSEGKNKAGRGGNPFVNANKRARSEQISDDNPHIQILQSSAELGLQNTRLLRLMFGSGVRASLAPKHAVLFDAYAVETDPSNPILADILRWRAIVTELLKLEICPARLGLYSPNTPSK